MWLLVDDRGRGPGEKCRIDVNPGHRWRTSWNGRRRASRRRRRDTVNDGRRGAHVWQHAGQRGRRAPDARGRASHRVNTWRWLTNWRRSIHARRRLSEAWRRETRRGPWRASRVKWRRMAGRRPVSASDHTAATLWRLLRRSGL